MTAPTVIPTETPIVEAEKLAAQDAADALVTLGWSVVPPSSSQPLWQVFDELLTTTQLLVVASLVAIVPRVKRSRQ